ncbi:MAG: YlmC/YmxH family sporulation protein [Bacillota bacterium]|jgi:YlmC/YmxH family sporulation protein
MVKISDLRMLEVINIGDGRRLGPIKDIDLNLEEGRIAAIVLTGHSTRLMGFLGREQELVVPWERVKKIGVDVILVDLALGDFERARAGDIGCRGEKYG